MDPETRVASMLRAVEALAGKTRRAATARMRGHTWARCWTARRRWPPTRRSCGNAASVDLAGVQSGFTDAAELRALCATADVGITSADYALADTGTLVMLASPAGSPLDLAAAAGAYRGGSQGAVLSGLDELLTILPIPPRRPVPWC
jgi:hypothetical protein